jgi:hypothetical protein
LSSGTELSIDHLGIRGDFLRSRFYGSTDAVKLLTKIDKVGALI